MGYLQHGRRHLPGGTDPVDLLPFWTPFTPNIDDGSLDDTLSYGYSMVQAANELATVAVQMRLVALVTPGDHITNLPGATGAGYNSAFAYILAGAAFTSSDPTDASTMWDTFFQAFVSGDGHIRYPNGGPPGTGPDAGYPDSGCAGDILFVGGGIYPYELDEGGTPLWPNP